MYRRIALYLLWRRLSRDIDRRYNLRVAGTPYGKAVFESFRMHARGEKKNEMSDSGYLTMLLYCYLLLFIEIDRTEVFEDDASSENVSEYEETVADIHGQIEALLRASPQREMIEKACSYLIIRADFPERAANGLRKLMLGSRPRTSSFTTSAGSS